MKYKKLFILIIIIVGTLLFYWYEIRPSNIRKSCEYQVFSKNRYSDTDSNNSYRQCLIRNGLSPESIFVNTE
ncbi:MAG: hypothetical protein HW400_778 [Candidatus Levybacteria bacterium]|nr:hypothetical protein [Candidatus Levybacteria bacterium]